MMKKLVSFTLVVVMVTVMMISVLTPLDYIVFAGTANTDTNTYTFDFSTDSPVVVINEKFITDTAQGCFWCAVAFLAILVAVVIFLWMLSIEPVFYDENSVIGVPSDIPQENGYTVYPAQGVCTVALCGNPEIDGRNVKLFLTNMTEEGIFLRAEIYKTNLEFDATGKLVSKTPGELLGQSGFIRPGEYVEMIKLDDPLSEDRTFVMVKIATYVEETGLSNGAFYIDTVFYQ